MKRYDIYAVFKPIRTNQLATVNSKPC